MNSEHNNQCVEKRSFFLGDDSDNESEYGGEPNNQRRFSMSESDSDDIVGGAPTNLNFAIDDDSGFGMSIDNDSNDSTDSSQILPLRPVSIGKHSSKPEHKQQRTRRSQKYHFNDFYKLSDDHLGSGAYASVKTCVSIETGIEFAVKLVNKHEPGHTRSRILREVDIFKMCRGHPNIVQLIEWFEDDEYFYMVFEKMQGGPLLSQIQNKMCFNEQEAAQVTKDIANALKFLHSKGIAHRDLKPENVLCCSVSGVAPVKLCDLDLASKPSVPGLRRASRQLQSVQSEPDLSSPVGSAEFLAPEVVETFVGESLKYNRQCDLWSLGIIIYIMLSGYVPFYGECDQADTCGWNQGMMCEDCQEDLFEKIRLGVFEFPEEEWSKISEEAKDLISHLLVKDMRKRYTASQVLAHPWISYAPETPLHTANNLCRNSSSKDIQQINDHFNINHFANRLSSRVEETIPSAGSTPENESALCDAYENDPNYSKEVLTNARKLLEQNGDSGEYTAEDQRMEAKYYSNQPIPPPYYPPTINMNDGVLYAPSMVSNAHVNHVPHYQMPVYYAQQSYYMAGDYHNYVDSQFNHQHQGYAHVPIFDPNAMKTLEPVVEEQPKRFDQTGRVNSALGLRPSTPSADATEKKKLQQHRGSLSTAISQLGLENCQNAMIRQGSSGKEIYQSRETQVNV